MKSSRVIAVFLTVSLFAGLFILPNCGTASKHTAKSTKRQRRSPAFLSADTSTPALNNASGGKAVCFGGARHDNELETIGPDLTFTVDIEKAALTRYGESFGQRVPATIRCIMPLTLRITYKLIQKAQTILSGF